VRRLPSVQVGLTSIALGLNSDLSKSNSGMTSLTPCLSPGVIDDPVTDSILDSPTNDLDSVPSDVRTPSLLVDTSFVGHEVRIYLHGSFDWTVGVDFLLHRCNPFEDLGATLFGVVLTHGYTILALIEGITSWDHEVLGSVWEAALGDGTVIFQESPGILQVTSIATLVACVAGNLVLRTKNNVGSFVRCDAETVAQNFCSGDGPA